jgi:hypothetical protein
MYQGRRVSGRGAKLMLRKWRTAGAVLGVLMTASLGFASLGSAEEPPPLSAADLKKLLSDLDSYGAKESFPPPMAKNLGLSQDEKRNLPVVSIVTSDHKVYFLRSGLDAKDLIVWVIGADEKSSAMFVTHQDLKLTRALYMHADQVPQLQAINDAAVVTNYARGLAALSQDLRKTK